MVTKCNECGQYRIHVDEDGICNICRESRNKDDLNIVVKGMEKQLNRLSNEFERTQLKVEKLGRLVDGLTKTIRNMKRNG